MADSYVMTMTLTVQCKMNAYLALKPSQRKQVDSELYKKAQITATPAKLKELAKPMLGKGTVQTAAANAVTQAMSVLSTVGAIFEPIPDPAMNPNEWVILSDGGHEVETGASRTNIGTHWLESASAFGATYSGRVHLSVVLTKLVLNEVRP